MRAFTVVVEYEDERAFSEPFIMAGKDQREVEYLVERYLSADPTVVGWTIKPAGDDQLTERRND